MQATTHESPRHSAGRRIDAVRETQDFDVALSSGHCA